ncbi:MAG: nickel pincer cofactor biosynthesis protein LarC, partial [Anaerolineales bacterium]
VDVLVESQPPERHLAQILEIINQSDLPESIRDQSSAIFQKIAEVEAEIHDTSLDQVHLHELGGTDTIIDVIGTLLALELLDISQIFASPIPTGSGFIQGAHGQIPLPAPATVKLLKGIPVFGTGIKAELVTPTGAALLAALVSEFGPAPELVLEKIGYGAGSRDLPIPNLLRVLTGKLANKEKVQLEGLVILESNLDDLNPEFYPFVMESLFQNGALDVAFLPIHMKKNRPGVQIQVLTDPSLAGKMRDILFEETSTLGIRQLPTTRFTLPRKSVSVRTPYGEIQVKIASKPGGEENVSPEYEDCQKLARENKVPLKLVYQAALSAYYSGTVD